VNEAWQRDRPASGWGGSWAAGITQSRRRLGPALLLLAAMSANAPAQESAQRAHHHHQAATSGAPVERTEHTYSVPDVMLKDTNGKSVALRPLLEVKEPVMLDFIYTSCTAVCPLLSETFAQVERELGSEAVGLRMVSISIDPEYDTPKVLRAYAQTYQAGAQWQFLTGSPNDVAEVQKAFDAYRANKMDHVALVFIRTSQAKPWIRFEGLVTPTALAREYRAMHSAP
jgi:protein SCO1/2